MADRVLPGSVDSSTCIREAVCIHTKKIFDSCRDKDCIEDLRVYPTACSQIYIDSALSVRPRSAKLLHVIVNVEEITFNRGYYTVDVTYFYKIKGEAFPGAHEVTGLAVFDKRVILFGGEGSVKIFSSDGCHSGCKNSNPRATVETVDPVALGMKIVDAKCDAYVDVVPDIPQGILEAIGEDINLSPENRLWFVTLGQFSIIRLERDSQLVIPVYDYCFPEKECEGGSDVDPCTIFGRMRFPVEEFFPADKPAKEEDCSKTD